ITRRSRTLFRGKRLSTFDHAGCWPLTVPLSPIGIAPDNRRRITSRTFRNRFRLRRMAMRPPRLLPSMLLLTLLLATRVGGELPIALSTNSSPEGTRTWEALKQPVKIDKQTDSLTAMLEHVAEQAGVELVIHPQAFASAG